MSNTDVSQSRYGGFMPHRKTVRHFEEPGHLHELTFSCYRRMPLLTNDDWRRRLERGLCHRAIDWKWSSARFYLADVPGHQHPEIPFVHGLPVGATC
jgi:hypothetical protein